MIIRGSPSYGQERQEREREWRTLHQAKAKERKHKARSLAPARPSSTSGPELKKSISMKMRYKMGLNKHAPSLSSATCLHLVRHEDDVHFAPIVVLVLVVFVCLSHRRLSFSHFFPSFHRRRRRRHARSGAQRDRDSKVILFKVL